MGPRELAALAVTASLLVPSPAAAQLAAGAFPLARPGASAFVMTLPTLGERRAYLLERLDGWHTMIPAKGELASDFLPEMADLKERLGAAEGAAQLTLWAFVLDAFENRLMERLNPELLSMAPEKRQPARLAILEQKEALVALNRRRVGADGRTRREIDGLKRQIKSFGLSGEGLGRLYDRTRQLTGAAVAPGLDAVAAAQGPAAGAFTDWSYPRPETSARPYGSLPVPEPGASGPPAAPTAADAALPRDSARSATIDEAHVIAVARQSGLNATIVRQAYRESARQGVDFKLVLAVIEAESGYNPNATSPVGARGLMQIMPATGRGLGVQSTGALYDVATNIRAGVKYLKGLWDRFSAVAWSELGSIDPSSRRDVMAAIAAYNAGPGAVRKYGGVPPYRETRGYVVKVLANYRKYDRLFG